MAGSCLASRNQSFRFEFNAFVLSPYNSLVLYPLINHEAAALIGFSCLKASRAQAENSYLFFY